MIRFSNADDFLEIDLAVETDPSLPSCGDARLAIGVCSAGFSGRATAWVQRDALERFRADLTSLVEGGRDAASLASMSPDELALRVSLATPLGVVGVEGTIGRHLYVGQGFCWHAVSFGFEVEFWQLDDALRGLASAAAGC